MIIQQISVKCWGAGVVVGNPKCTCVGFFTREKHSGTNV